MQSLELLGVPSFDERPSSPPPPPSRSLVEAPWLAPGDDTPVEAGMVFSNEPGIYRPGIDGWRTINTMIVGEQSDWLQDQAPNPDPAS